MLKQVCLSIIAVFLVSWAPGSAAPGNLRCEYLINPLGVDVSDPRLSWTLPVTGRGEIQTAYQISVSSTPDGAGDLWSSGKVTGSSTHVPYGGAALTSGQECYWKVESCSGADGGGPCGVFSETWTFTTTAVVVDCLAWHES